MRKWILGVGAVFILGLVGVVTAQYVLVQAPQRTEMQAMDVRMDELDSYMKSKGAAQWAPRQYLFDTIEQAWYVPGDANIVIDESFDVTDTPQEDGYRIIKVSISR